MPTGTRPLVLLAIILIMLGSLRFSVLQENLFFNKRFNLILFRFVDFAVCFS